MAGRDVNVNAEHLPPGTSSAGRCLLCGEVFESAFDGSVTNQQGYLLTGHRRTGRKLSDHVTAEHPQEVTS